MATLPMRLTQNWVGFGAQRAFSPQCPPGRTPPAWHPKRGDAGFARLRAGNSPCQSDAVAFLTGARVQYGNLGFFKDKHYGHAIVLYREDTGTAVLATWKTGINNIPGEPVVLPGAIDWKSAVDTDQVLKLK